MSTGQSGFLPLPVELQIEVAEYITSKADLKSLCLTSKQARTVATPLLYHSVTLSITQLKSVPEGFFAKNSIGIRHIRSLRVLDDSEFTECYCLDVHDEAFCHLLEVLPEDCLTHFEFDTVEPVSEDIVNLLRTRQHRLTNYQFQPLAHLRKTLVAVGEAELGVVTSIRLYLEWPLDCKEARKLLRHAPNLTHLDVHATEEFGREHDLIFTSLFGSHSSDEPSHIVLQLKRLTLRGFDLQRVTAADWRTGLGPVRELVLIDCSRFEDILAELQEPRLRSLQIIRGYCPHRVHHVTSRSMDQFLEKLEELEQLHISWKIQGAHGFTKWTYLTRHATSLRSLRLDELPDDEVPSRTRLFVDDIDGRSLEDFRKMCTGCSILEQVALVMPDPDPKNWEKPGGLRDLLSCLRHSRALKALRLFVYIHDQVEKKDPSLLRHAKMQKLANTIFETLSDSCPRFLGLVLDVRTDNPDGTDTKLPDDPDDDMFITIYEAAQDCATRNVEQFGYMRGRQIDVRARVRPVGVPSSHI